MNRVRFSGRHEFRNSLGFRRVGVGAAELRVCVEADCRLQDPSRYPPLQKAQRWGTLRLKVGG
jgi:hypothetical protein